MVDRMQRPEHDLLVIGFGEWIADPAYGVADMALAFVVKLALGAVLGLAAGWLARRVIARVELPTQGLYPVATLATAALSYGVAELAGGSGFLAVYVTALVLGTGSLPARSTPTTPVLPMPRCTSSPKWRSFSATKSEVRFSSKPSSGWAWMSRRQRVISSCRRTMASITAILLLVLTC